MLIQDVENVFGFTAKEQLLKSLNRTSDQEELASRPKQQHLEIEYMKRYYYQSEAEVKLNKLISHLVRTKQSYIHLHRNVKEVQIKNMELDNRYQNPQHSKSTSFRFKEQQEMLLTESLLQSKNVSLDESHWKQLLGLKEPDQKTQKKSNGRNLNYIPFKHKNTKNIQKCAKFCKQLQCLQNNMATTLRKLNKSQSKANLSNFSNKRR